MTTLIDSPHFGLVHDSAFACLYATWYGPYDASCTQATYELICLFRRLTQSTKLLNEGPLDPHGWREITTWLGQGKFQRLSQEGLVAVAWVLPRDTQALCATYKLLALVGRPLVELFDDSEAAYSWLHQWPRVHTTRPQQTYL